MLKHVIKLVIVLSISLLAMERVKMEWFNSKSYSVLEIKRGELGNSSNYNVLDSMVITDKKVIDSLIEEINKVSVNGKEMAKFGPGAERVDLLFKNGDTIQLIQVYEKQFKTPTTGFNMANREFEEEVYNKIIKLLIRE